MLEKRTIFKSLIHTIEKEGEFSQNSVIANLTQICKSWLFYPTYLLMQNVKVNPLHNDK